MNAWVRSHSFIRNSISKRVSISQVPLQRKKIEEVVYAPLQKFCLVGGLNPSTRSIKYLNIIERLRKPSSLTERKEKGRVSFFYEIAYMNEEVMFSVLRDGL